VSKLFKHQAQYLALENNKYTSTLRKLENLPGGGPVAAWRSNRFLVQLFPEQAGAQRITINRTMVDVDTGRWLDGITWEEIQSIKDEIGFADRDAIEIYPATGDVVNVANMRHIWLVDRIAFAWRKGIDHVA
jgi:hypothetical protein